MPSQVALIVSTRREMNAPLQPLGRPNLTGSGNTVPFPVRTIPRSLAEIKNTFHTPVNFSKVLRCLEGSPER